MRKTSKHQPKEEKKIHAAGSKKIPKSKPSEETHKNYSVT